MRRKDSVQQAIRRTLGDKVALEFGYRVHLLEKSGIDVYFGNNAEWETLDEPDSDIAVSQHQTFFRLGSPQRLMELLREETKGLERK